MFRRVTLWLAVAAMTAAVVPLVSATPAHALAGLSYATAASGYDSNSPKTITAFCPSGMAAIGGGGLVTGATGDATMRSIRPFRGRLGLNGVSVIAEEDPDGYAG